MAILLSKSKYLSGFQCPKLLWTQYNDKAAIPEPDVAKQAIFDTGHAVGDLAKQLFPGGEEVPWSGDLVATVAATETLMQKRIPIFEASFLHEGCYCRVDLLVPVEDGAWDVYEVKSSSSVKEINLHDVAFQAFVLEGSGVKLDRLFLTHIDNTYVRDGAIDPEGLFLSEDVTAEVQALKPFVSPQVASMKKTIGGERPDVPIGPHCTSPYSCDLWDSCSSFLPEQNVLNFYRIRKPKAFEMIDGGVLGLADATPENLNAKQLIQQEAVRTGLPQVSRDDLRRWLDGLVYPLHCLDFETMNPAIPLLDGTRPFQQVPFQFSLHVIPEKGAEPQHHEFLAESPSDPRAVLVDALKAIGAVGDVMAYNAGFERRVIRELADDFPEDSSFLMDLEGRFVDLMTPFSRFWCYYPEQKGSCSLKAVLPAVVGTTYEGMEIGDGGTALREFQRVVFGDVSADERASVLHALRVYCRQDTQALVDVLAELYALCGSDDRSRTT